MNANVRLAQGNVRCHEPVRDFPNRRVMVFEREVDAGGNAPAKIRGKAGVPEPHEARLARKNASDVLETAASEAR